MIVGLLLREGLSQMRKKKKLLYFVTVFLVLTMGIGTVGFRLVQHEKNQNYLLFELSARVDTLESRVNILEAECENQSEANVLRRSCAENKTRGGTTTWQSEIALHCTES